jgi:hypothetical protein
MNQALTRHAQGQAAYDKAMASCMQGLGCLPK